MLGAVLTCRLEAAVEASFVSLHADKPKESMSTVQSSVGQAWICLSGGNQNTACTQQRIYVVGPQMKVLAFSLSMGRLGRHTKIVEGSSRTTYVMPCNT